MTDIKHGTKQKASHTPGTWEANGSTVIASKESFRALFDCKPLRMTLSADECAANARLIAAAPDLLGALQAILQDADAISYATPHLSGDYWEEARAAIAKAIGLAA
ncbi:MAG: hypothetical protein K8U57_27525 [Planctomycetes bacterium]|nr:hypothetical protein [Planctomycetota bacterium]